MENLKNEKKDPKSEQNLAAIKVGTEVQIKSTRPSDLVNAVKQQMSQTTLPKDQIVYSDKTISFLDQVNGKYIRRKINFNTPRTKEAAAKIGITYQDCVKK